MSLEAACGSGFEGGVEEEGIEELNRPLVLGSSVRCVRATPIDAACVSRELAGTLCVPTESLTPDARLLPPFYDRGQSCAPLRSPQVS